MDTGSHSFFVVGSCSQSLTVEETLQAQMSKSEAHCEERLALGNAPKFMCEEKFNEN